MSTNTLEAPQTSDSPKGIYSNEPINYAEAAIRYQNEAKAPGLSAAEVKAKQDTANYLARRADEIASLGDKAINNAENPSDKE